MPKKISFKRLQRIIKNPTVPSKVDDLVEEGSLDKIENLSISFVKGKKDFSLKTLSKDKEFIQNPKILELDNYSKLENTQDTPDDKFSNEDDPFYQLDDERSEVSKQSSRSTEKYVKPSTFSSSRIAAKLTKNRNLKQLKNTR